MTLFHSPFEIFRDALPEGVLVLNLLLEALVVLGLTYSSYDAIIAFLLNVLFDDLKVLLLQYFLHVAFPLLLKLFDGVLVLLQCVF